MDTKSKKKLAAQKEEWLRAALKVEAELADAYPEERQESTYTSRFEVPLPEPRDKSKYNPNKYVDVETFITHPHFLGLTPYPWQTLALKLFYAGSEGNSNLEFNFTSKEEVEDCSRCVWKYIRDNEEKCLSAQEKDEFFSTILSPTNSPCLRCKRCPEHIRKNRLEYEVQSAADKDKEESLTELLELEVEDLFQSEKDLIDAIPDQAVREQILKKLGNKFQELVMVIGRRGTKSFMTVVIALYELYKLLALPNPQRKHKLVDFQEIHILNVARNEDQARDAIFVPIKNNALSSPFFQKYIDEDLSLEMRFFTEFDLAENKKREAKGASLVKGTIIVKSGTSSASGLVGKTCWCVILDELAAMAGDNPNSGLDKKLYDDLKPSIATFGKDGKIISLSNPKGPVGQLYHLYNSRIDDKSTLVLKAPTWQLNANVDRQWLESERRKDPIEYNMQYGAEFGTNSENPFFSEEDITHAFESSVMVSRMEEREMGYDYYCHVDPANRSDYYTIVVVRALNTRELDANGQIIKHFQVVHIHFWAPLKMRQPVSIATVEEYILDLHRRFNFVQISFDQWGALETIDRLKMKGLPAVLKVFNKEYKDKIYLKLLDVFRAKRITFYRMSGGVVLDKNQRPIDIYEIPEAKEQFIYLQKKWKNGRQTMAGLTGYKDDICDATAAAVFEASCDTAVLKSLPRARIAYTGAGLR